MGDLDSAELIAEVASVAVGHYVGWTTFALIVYEYLITIGAEVELFWKQKITGASVLFLANRYLMLFYTLSLLRGYGPFTLSVTSITSCTVWASGTRTLEILSYVPWGCKYPLTRILGFSAFRVFALTNGNWLIALPVFLLSMAPVGINFADFRWTTTMIDPIWGCSQVTVIGRASLITADLIVIVVTWFATYKTIRLARAIGHRTRMRLTVLLLRDGMIYFIVLLAMNMMHLTLSMVSVFIVEGIGSSRVSNVIQIIQPMNAILVWRFMLDLQETRWRIEELTTIGETQHTSSSVVFDRVIGSIGDSLQLAKADP
ncbi:hypothetical protein LXA43DRAFT_977319 [Ganoderma leucocontextum]|nr:hypothetical protein LXA43DRAFT_977319 [Ganoderma leucocontextum]